MHKDLIALHGPTYSNAVFLYELVLFRVQIKCKPEINAKVTCILTSYV